MYWTDTLQTVPVGIYLRESVARIYPQPAGDEVWIEFAQPLSEELGVALFDMTGKLVQESRIGESGESEIQLDVSMLEKGFYILRFRKGKEIISKKLIID